MSAPLSTQFHGEAFRRRLSGCTMCLSLLWSDRLTIGCQHKYETTPRPCVNSCSNGVQPGPDFGSRTATVCPLVTPWDNISANNLRVLFLHRAVIGGTQQSLMLLSDSVLIDIVETIILRLYAIWGLESDLHPYCGYSDGHISTRPRW